MNKMNRLAIATLAVASMALAQDAKKVTSHDGMCQVSVPANWEVSGAAGIGTSADKKVSVAVGSPNRIASFDVLKQNARKMYSDDKVTKDSPAEFQMEGQSMNGKPNVYRGIPIANAKFCIVEVIYQSGNVADARKVAATLKSAK